ncbi:hypothetical protein RHSIM_Rhsim02G0187300 [Rhododendron simsii]|uniref:Uncharacterized protein n=1 Tax=Rhododendron simsii TaxID=118357 RepID=A0A834LVT9_RHOSS|nr:hypothetical protein RHSIM_Rhsim02G0187300 [Rhododendron simsii]
MASYLFKLVALVTPTREASFDILTDSVEFEGLVASLEKPLFRGEGFGQIFCFMNQGVKYLKYTSDSDVSLGEFEAQYEEKKTKFNKMASSYGKMAFSISKLSERVISLEEKITRTMKILKKLESELSSCKAKQSSSQSDLIKYSENISNYEKDLHAALDVVEQRKRKGAHYDAMKGAFDAVSRGEEGGVSKKIRATAFLTLFFEVLGWLGSFLFNFGEN